MVNKRLREFPLMVFVVASAVAYVQSIGASPEAGFSGAWEVVDVQRSGKSLARDEWPVRDNLKFSKDFVIGLPSTDKADASYFEVTARGDVLSITRYASKDKGRYDDIIAYAIVRITGDEMRWCEAPAAKVAPASFATHSSNENLLIVFRRTR